MRSYSLDNTANINGPVTIPGETKLAIMSIVHVTIRHARIYVCIDICIVYICMESKFV